MANTTPANTGHTPPSVQADQERLLSVIEARQRLNVSHAYIYKLFNSGALPSLTLGRSRKVRLSDLHAFIAGRVAA